MHQQTYWQRIFASKYDRLDETAQRQVRTALVGKVRFTTFDEFREEQRRVQQQEQRLPAGLGEQA